VLRVTDRRSGQVLGWITRQPPAKLRGHEDKLPGPEAADVLVRDEPATDEPGWTVRADPDPEPETEVA